MAYAQKRKQRGPLRDSLWRQVATQLEKSAGKKYEVTTVERGSSGAPFAQPRLAHCQASSFSIHTASCGS